MNEGGCCWRRRLTDAVVGVTVAQLEAFGQALRALYSSWPAYGSSGQTSCCDRQPHHSWSRWQQGEQWYQGLSVRRGRQSWTCVERRANLELQQRRRCWYRHSHHHSRYQRTHSALSSGMMMQTAAAGTAALLGTGPRTPHRPRCSPQHSVKPLVLILRVRLPRRLDHWQGAVAWQSTHRSCSTRAGRWPC